MPDKAGFKQVNIQVPEEEYKIIEQKAKENTMSISSYMRFVSMRADIKVVVKNK